MLPKKYSNLIFAFFMGLMMSGLMSFVISLLNIGWIEGIWVIWLKSWSIAFFIAFPAIVVIAPVVRKLVAVLVSDD